MTKPMSLFRMLALPAASFVFLALPALLVIEEVRRKAGLNWALSVGLMTLFILSVAGGRRSARVLLAGLVGVFVFLNTALSVSFIMQGTAFNTAFFSHLDLSTLKIAWKTDALRMLIMSLYILAAPFVVYRVTAEASGLGKWLSQVPTVLKVAVLALSLWVNYPINALAQHRITTTQSSERLLAEIAALRSQAPAGDVLVADAKNLVLIYLEGIEQNYLDEELFPGMTPNLNRLREEALWFSDVHQFPGAEWTIGGIVSSQCGVPLLSERQGNRILSEIGNPFERISCLAEYLRASGYRTAYIGGASLEFAGKGSFLRDNGYDLRLGIDELPNSTSHNWGMYDNDMFAHASELFDGLVEGGDPFLLTVLTLDSHHPTGTPSPGCAPYPDSPVVMLGVVSCVDRLLNGFLDHLRQSPAAEDTVIAIMSDHLLIRGDAEELLEAKDRRILFMVLDPARAPREFAGPATHFDVAPTLLEAIGITNADFAFGQSLLSHEMGRAFERNLTEKDFQPFKVERLTESLAN